MAKKKYGFSFSWKRERMRSVRSLAFESWSIHARTEGIVQYPLRTTTNGSALIASNSILVSPPQFASHGRQSTAFKERQVDGVAYRTAILLGKELQVSGVTSHVRIGWQILEKRVADKHHKLASRPGQRHIESSWA